MNKLLRMKLRPRHPKRMARRSTYLALTLRKTTRRLRLRQEPSLRTKRLRETNLCHLIARPAESETPQDQ
jgi:hypothetical protein